MSIRPEIDLKEILIHVEKPGRYTGGEYGKKKQLDHTITTTVALCFPDLYEIGMSNNAIRILFDQINQIPGVYCDVVFTPAPDFAEVLKNRDIPLYGLQSGKPIREFDILAFSVGYELAATNILSVLDLSGIPFHPEDRSEDDPVVIAGGPAVTNPVPFLRWIDGVFIGESEAYGGLTTMLNELDDQHHTRSLLFSRLSASKHLVTRDSERSVSAVYDDFTLKSSPDPYFLVPSISIVQEHGVVEIMRGCPNGCRFCHAGEFYKPYRHKNLKMIIDEVEQNLDRYGYREITLSSLSTGDYPHLDKLIELLNLKFSNRNISFSLPSLKVNTFTLPVLKAVSNVRKSGLTFAIETPDQSWQRAMNKVVPVDQISQIISSAKDEGWRVAKFYFMTGLPFTDREQEVEQITSYLKTIADRTRIQMNINIGTFVPKPHTPFQWAAQLDPETALQHLKAIKKSLLDNIKHIKVNFHDPYVSLVEGMLSRGDHRAGLAAEIAYQNGAKLDAWDEHFKPEIWQGAMSDAGIDITSDVCREKDIDEALPWDAITIGAGRGYLKREYRKAQIGALTVPCNVDCDHLCGVCDFSDDQKTQVRDVKDENLHLYEDLYPRYLSESRDQRKTEIADYVHLILEYEKSGTAVYLSHINMMKNFELMFQRLGIDIEFTHGFNPKPRLEFMSPLPLGISGKHEVFMFRVPEYEMEKVLSEEFIKEATNQMMDGVTIKHVAAKGNGHKSISSVYDGGIYEIAADTEEKMETLEQLLSGLEDEHEHLHISPSSSGFTVHIEEKPKRVSNILKLIDPIMPKYDFLATFSVERTYPLAPGNVQAFTYLTTDK
jgi:radical SAM-linked protein